MSTRIPPVRRHYIQIVSRSVNGVAITTALITTLALLSATGQSPGEAHPPVVVAGEPVKPDIESLAVPAVTDRSSMRSMAKEPDASEEPKGEEASKESERPKLGAGDRVVARLTERATQDFSMLGVTWQAGTAGPDLQVEVRTRDDSGWSDWEEIEVDLDHGPAPGEEGPGVRGGTAPLWVDSSDGISVRVLGEDLKGPRDVEVELIDPGETSRLELSAMTFMPRIITRRQWGVDHSLDEPCWKPIAADTVKAVFVHHTAGSNNYSRSDSDNIVRGIHAYHTKGRGWCDIGYNVLIDRYGQMFEGRRGGLRKPIRGAHAGEVNTGSVGISLMGNFQNAYPTAKMKDALVHLAAWELESRYRNPKGHAWLAGKRYNVISGHRDAMSTACPGRRVYNWLPELRNRVANRVGNWRASSIYKKWQRLGGESGWVGSPFMGERWQDGGRNTVFSNATIFHKSGLGPHEVHGAIRSRYRKLGDGGSALGFPRTDTHNAGRRDDAERVGFEHGRIYWSKSTGAHEVRSRVMNAYGDAGGAAGFLGFPESGTHTAGRQSGALRNSFEHGRIYWSKSTGGHEVHSRIMNAYGDVGGAAGVMGFPVSGTHTAGRQSGALRNSFEHGRIYWSKSTGAHEVRGRIMRAYAYHGGAAGFLGFPVSGTHTAGRQPGALRGSFEHGRIYWSRSTGMREVHGPIMGRYASEGGAAGALGFPVTGVRDVSGGQRSDFEHGWIRWDRSRNQTTVHYD